MADPVDAIGDLARALVLTPHPPGARGVCACASCSTARSRALQSAGYAYEPVPANRRGAEPLPAPLPEAYQALATCHGYYTRTVDKLRIRVPSTALCDRSVKPVEIARGGARAEFMWGRLCLGVDACWASKSGAGLLAAARQAFQSAVYAPPRVTT